MLTHYKSYKKITIKRERAPEYLLKEEKEKVIKEGRYLEVFGFSKHKILICFQKN